MKFIVSFTFYVLDYPLVLKWTVYVIVDVSFMYILNQSMQVNEYYKHDKSSMDVIFDFKNCLFFSSSNEA